MPGQLHSNHVSHASDMCPYGCDFHIIATHVPQRPATFLNWRREKKAAVKKNSARLRPAGQCGATARTHCPDCGRSRLNTPYKSVTHNTWRHSDGYRHVPVFDYDLGMVVFMYFLDHRHKQMECHQ